MDDPQVGDNRTSGTAPCDCVSGLPDVLCCGGRRELAGLGASGALPGGAQQDVAARWALIVTTTQALASALPDVPVPLLGGRTPRELYTAGDEERAAALGYLHAVARTAAAVQVPFPVEDLAAAIAAPPPSTITAGPDGQHVLASFSLQMLSRGFDTAAVLGAQRLLRDVLRVVKPSFRKPLAYASAIDYAMCWMHFRPETRSEVAALYRVSPATTGKHFATMKRDLKLVWYDPRYAVPEPTWQEMLEETARALADGESPDP